LRIHEYFLLFNLLCFFCAFCGEKRNDKPQKTQNVAQKDYVE
jgi:hypothetical protein